MAAIILFQCRACESEIRLAPNLVEAVSCPHCKAPVPVRMEKSLCDGGPVHHCVACGHDALYVQKDFNRNLGLAIVVIGVLASLIFFSRSEPILAMIALVAMAGIDLAIYSLVQDVTVCYCCHAVYRGFPKNPEHQAFDLKNLEKYGGREPRF